MVRVVRGLRGELLAPYNDAQREARLVGEQHNIDQFELLDHIARVGVPLDVGSGGNLERELAYVNHSSAE